MYEYIKNLNNTQRTLRTVQIQCAQKNLFYANAPSMSKCSTTKNLENDKINNRKVCLKFCKQ